MNNPKDDLQHIRQMMEQSSRFISLSGLSGVVAGVIALAGAGLAYTILLKNGIDYSDNVRSLAPVDLLWKLILLAIIILVLAVGSGIWFTVRKSKQKGLKIWTRTTQLLLVNLFVPLLAGGIFCIALIYHGSIGYVAPATLVFYGLALVNGAKLTYSDIQYLGYCEVFLGLVAMFLPGYGLIFWALGFGVLHIVYGIVMYQKYK
ncbi:MAG: hypothetical protein ACK5NK_12965 [Niabella sp.]